MNDISLAYGRGAAGSSGFQNYYPYSLGDYYRGGLYVPLYDPGGPNGAVTQSQSNVDMNRLRGTQALTFFTTITNTSSGGKFAANGYGTSDSGFPFGTSTDTQAGNFKCYGTRFASITYQPLGFSLVLTVFGNLQNTANAWYSLAILAVTAGDFTSYTFLRENATFGAGATSSNWTWITSNLIPGTYSPYNPLPILGNQYQLKVRRTSSY